MDELWGRCPKCHEWFHIEDPSLDNLFLCPVCLIAAYRTERRPAEDRESGDGAA